MKKPDAAKDTTKLVGFPRELLDAPRPERIAYFRAYTAGHPALNYAVDELAAALDGAGDTDLVIVYGPPGAGKTTLLEITMRMVIDEMLPSMDDDKGLVPIVGFPAVARGPKEPFVWSDCWRRALLAIDDPLVTDKRLPRAPLRLAQGRLPAVVPTKMEGNSALLLAWEQALRERRPRAVLIDEAQDMFAGLSFRSLQKQLNCLKGQADRTGVLHVLFGTYDLLAVTELSAQLTRRSTTIHLPRYLLERPRDVVAFKKVLEQFQLHLPLEEMPDLLGQWEFLYERSIGCIGVLKQWLARALARALRKRAPTLDRKKHLEPSAFSRTAILNMLIEAREAEANLARRELAAGDPLDALLRTPLPLVAPKKTPRQVPGNAAKTGKPFERAPGRDPVGMAGDGE